MSLGQQSSTCTGYPNEIKQSLIYVVAQVKLFMHSRLLPYKHNHQQCILLQVWLLKVNDLAHNG